MLEVIAITNHRMQRKDALKKLIELSRSPHQSLKKLAASNITKFFKPFPDLEEDAINAIYDLCEDQDSKVKSISIRPSCI